MTSRTAQGQVGNTAWHTLRLVLLVGTLGGVLAGCSSAPERIEAPVVQRDPSGIPDAVPRVEPRSRSGNMDAYTVRGRRYFTKDDSTGHVERGIASWYGPGFHGRKTSNGEPYDMNAMTAAHKTLPLPTYARVTNLQNGKTAVVRINDRGPFHGPRVIDLSRAAATKLGVIGTGTAEVEVRALDPTSSDPVAGNPFLIAASKPRSEAKPQSFGDSLAEFGTARFEAPTAALVADGGRTAAPPQASRPSPLPPRQSEPTKARELVIAERPTQKTRAEFRAEASAARAEARLAAKEAEAMARFAAKQAKAEAQLAAKEAKSGSRVAAKDTKATKGRGDVVDLASAKGKAGAVAEAVVKGGKADKAGKAEKSDKGGSGMYVQAGAFGDRANAEQLRKRLVKELAKLQVQVRSIDGKASSLYKVQIGPLDSRAKASDVSQQLAALGVSKSHVVVE
jgi:rare lipoprotein A